MNTYLENGYKFEVEEKKGSFEIKETIGRGASCVVYRADFTDENGNITEHILKEYNPKHIEFFREETGKLVLESEDDSEEFVLGLEHFISGYQKQLNIRKISELKNATTNIQDIYCANSTQYIDMTCFNGLTYSKMNEKSLYDLLRRIKALTCVIANYHNAGFLHLDIKPENIYTIPETTEFLMLFDFDSVVEKDKIDGKSVLSYTMSWAAPEQITKNYNKICGATDIFAIGEILFYQIMGRHSEMKERRSFGEYQFDYDSEIFENVNPKVYPLLSEVFHKTICTAVDKRFQSAEELLSALENIIALADPKALFIKSNLPEPQSFFVGREKEIEEIHNRLENNRTLFVSGVGGIGKSELVKQYAKKYKNEYDAVIFAPYVSDMNMLIADDTAVPVYNLFKYPAEQPEEYMQRKWRKLKELCDEGTLIIVDNLDRDDDPDLNKLLELGCKLIITTRVDFSDYSYEQLDVRTLKSREEINAIFNEYYKKPLDETAKGFVREIIDIVDGHTMTIELLAKQMMAGRITPEKMLSKLRDGGIGDSGKEKVLTGKDGVRSAMRAYEHIRALFDVSDLSEDEIYILANLSLIPHTGVPTELFHDWCELDGYDGINELVHTGWIRCDKEKDFISLHPVIGDLAFDLLNERNVDVAKFLSNLTEFSKEDNFENIGFESLEEKADFLYKVSA
ncbi:MAG: NB-ARC domain-containing protein, partial [Acutalibacteraceae bacterium]|nr:NB-ARC domain-containing protein [Acutalibacteraceae bacterium]